MNRTTNILLTVIAACLVAITYKLYAGDIIIGPTVEDALAVQDIDDEKARTLAIKKLTERLPLVRIHSGYVDVSGHVDAGVTGTVSVDQ